MRTSGEEVREARWAVLADVKRGGSVAREARTGRERDVDTSASFCRRDARSSADMYWRSSFVPPFPTRFLAVRYSDGRRQRRPMTSGNLKFKDRQFPCIPLGKCGDN